MDENSAPFVARVTVTLNDGRGFEMVMDEGFASGTTFDNDLPDSALALEAAIQDAIQEVGLNPAR